MVLTISKCSVNNLLALYDSLIMNGAIIAAAAVVVKDVSDYSIVSGNPAKVVKMRFDDKTINRLLKIAWWDWNIEKINQNLKLICNLDVDRLEEAGFSR